MAKTTDNTAKFQAGARRAIASGLTAAAQRVAAIMKINMSRGNRMSAAPIGRPPNRQQSNLANSIGHIAAKESGGKFVSSAGTALPSGRIHELGGVIKPGPGKKYLVGPVNIAAKRAMEKTSGGVRSLKTRIFRSKKGNLIMIGDKKVRYRNDPAGIRVNAQPVFVLKESVRMPKRPWAAPALAKAKTDPTFQLGVKIAMRKALQNFATEVKT